jgi:Tfp pilus assembly protein PilN
MMVIKDINFLPDYVYQKQVKLKRKTLTLIYMAAAVLILTGLFGIPKITLSYYQYQEAKSKGELIGLIQLRKKINTLNEIKLNMNQKQNALNEIAKKKISVLELIGKIENVLPSNIKIKGYRLIGKNLNISFSVEGTKDIIVLMDKLDELKMFEKVDIDSIPLIDEEYTMNMELKLK